MSVGGIEYMLWCYACVALRLGPSLACLPPFSSVGVSWSVRLLLLSMLCLSIAPLLGGDLLVEMPESLGHGVGVLLSELLFGAAVGLSVQLFLSAFQTAGASLADLSGLNLNDTEDEYGVSSQVQRVLIWTTGVLFVLGGGHRWVLHLVLETFERFPLGSGIDSTELLYEVPVRFGQALSVAMRMAFPAAVVMFAIGIARAWLTRGFAAWDRLALGGSLQLLAMVWGMLMSLSAIGWLYQEELAVWMDHQQRAVLELSPWSTSSEVPGGSANG